MSQYSVQLITRHLIRQAAAFGGLLAVLISSLSILMSAGVALANDNFEDSEIRVIKNKYFEKSMRLELSAGLSSVMNQAFLYTYLGGFNVGFHITEQFGVQGEAYLGQTVRKGDCDTLGSSFRIDPVVQEIQNYFGGALSYTPVYGKFQLASGRVIYFDWFFEGGGGMSSIRSGGVGCAAGGSSSEEVPVEGSALSIHGSTGMRIFLNENVSLNWRVRMMRAEGILNDGSNNAKKTGLGTGAQNYVLLNLGVSYFL
jgi:outer membrane beta-barrel protein